MKKVKKANKVRDIPVKKEETPKVEKKELLEGIIKCEGGYKLMVESQMVDKYIGSNAFSEAVKAYKVLVLGR